MPAAISSARRFAHYARYYDLLYRDKDYTAETAFVDAQLRRLGASGRRLLDLGCGTGRHAMALVQLGWKVTGVDLSPAMVKQARTRAKQATPAIRPVFQVGDITALRTRRRYDAVVSLFHVLGYQTSNHQLEAACLTAAKHLEPGGIFIFDYWFGPAVLTTPPSVRVKRFEDNRIAVTRVAEPQLDAIHNVVNIDFDVLVEDKRTHQLDHIRENHRVRYFFVPELKQALAAAGLKVIDQGAWLSRNPLDTESWYGWMAAQLPR